MEIDLFMVKTIFSWLWANVVVGGSPVDAIPAIPGQTVADGAEVALLRQVGPIAPSLAGLVIYTGDGHSNTDYGALGANDAMEVALAHHYPTWRNTGEWRRWQKLDLSNPFYRYAALLNVFQYASPEGYAFKRNPSNPRQLGFFPS